MKIEMTRAVEQKVAAKIRREIEDTREYYFYHLAMGDAQMVAFYQDKYDRAMNWLIQHGLEKGEKE